jgi:hypothetical protein
VTVSPELQRLYASAPDAIELRETLELAHPLFAATHYVTNGPLAFTAALEGGGVVTFEPLPFGVKLPGANAGGNQDLGLVVDNVDREIIDELERASADPSVRIAATYRAYTSDNLTEPGSDPIALSLSDISAGMTRVEATATRTDVLNKRFPAVLYDVHRFPGLDR